jgi:hypothetical protein
MTIPHQADRGEDAGRDPGLLRRRLQSEHQVTRKKSKSARREEYLEYCFVTKSGGAGWPSRPASLDGCRSENTLQALTSPTDDPQGAGLLWCWCNPAAAEGLDVAPLHRGASGERGQDRLPGVVLCPTGDARRDRVAGDLGPRLLASQSRGAVGVRFLVCPVSSKSSWLPTAEPR